MQSSPQTPEERPDPWPEDHESQARLILELDTASRRRLSLPNQEHFEPDPFRREQIVDLATDRLLARAANLDPPRRPRGWYFTVVKHLLQSDEIPRHRTAALGFEPGVSPPDPDRERERDEARALDEARRTWLEAQVPLLAELVSKNELVVLDGSLADDSLRAARRGTSPTSARP